MPGFQSSDFDPEEKGLAIKKSLNEKGLKVIISDYGKRSPMRESIVAYVEQVKKEIKEVKPEIIIAHSLGGFLAREILESAQENLGVKILIMLETPHNGVPLKLILWLGYPDWPVIREIAPDSQFIQSLNQNWRLRLKSMKTRYFQIGGGWTIQYPEIFRLEDVKMITFQGLDHSSLRTDPRVIQKIIEILSS